jgi:hypothetical protein
MQDLGRTRLFFGPLSRFRPHEFAVSASLLFYFIFPAPKSGFYSAQRTSQQMYTYSQNNSLWYNQWLQCLTGQSLDIFPNVPSQTIRNVKNSYFILFSRTLCQCLVVCWEHPSQNLTSKYAKILHLEAAQYKIAFRFYWVMLSHCTPFSLPGKFIIL